MHYGTNTEQVKDKTNETYEIEVVMDCDLYIDKARSLTLTPDDKDYFAFEAPLLSKYPVRDKDQRRIKEDDQQAQDHILTEDQKTAAEDESYNLQDHLCIGEIIDDIYDLQPLSTEHSENTKEENKINGNNNLAEDNSSCSEKRRLFSLTHSPGSSVIHSVDSLSSELSSQSRHSVTSFLQAREYDAEDVLLNLGLGGDCRMSVPERFLITSSSAKGIDLDVIKRNIDEEEDDVFDNNSMSYSSSWSERNQIIERLPTRFVTSTSSFGSTTDVSEPDDNDPQISSLPVIVEPDQNDENSFDLMRHLRLNRNQNPSRDYQHDRNLLEPVTEELEVSSNGSGSVRTKISNTQEDSLESVGNISVLTKISRRQSEDSCKERLLLDNISFQEDPCEDNQQDTDKDESVERNIESNEQCYEDDERTISTENSNGDAQTNQGDNESGISSAGDSINLNLTRPLKPPILRVLASDTVHHDSFELEEIATSEENLDKIRYKRLAEKDNGKIKLLRRDNSDESSGFEDDTQVKKRSTESLDVDDVKICSLANQNDSIVNSDNIEFQKPLLVPFEVSTPKTDVEIRRSAFSKRSSWSTTKQKRVAFQDETLELRPKSRSFDESNLTAYKLETRRYSLDTPLTCTETHEADLVAETTEDNKDTSKILQHESTHEKTAVHNIRKFLSSLMSIRSKFRKTQQEEEMVPTNNTPPTSLASSQIPSNTSAQCSSSTWTEVSDSVFLKYDVEQGPRDERHDVSNAEIQCFISGRGAYKNHCLEELDSFEEDLNRYRASFMAMEMMSTSQDSYYTKKLLARFAWDIVTIRRLRSLIKNELASMQSCLTDRRLHVSELSDTPLPHGVVDKMKCLLAMQCSLQSYLLKLAESSPRFHWKTTPSPLWNSSVVNTSERTMEDMTNEIKHSLFQDFNQMFKEQVESLRKEIKEKDDVINELLIKVERIEKASAGPKHGL